MVEPVAGRGTPPRLAKRRLGGLSIQEPSALLDVFQIHASRRAICYASRGAKRGPARRRRMRLISKRQIVRLLIAGKESFLEEGRGVLRAGLANAAWISVDDTGARHKARNGFCTQIGNAQFAWFGTTGSKSRLNFLELLRAGHGDYVINAEALAYMRTRALAGPIMARLAGHVDHNIPQHAPHPQERGI